MSWLDRLLGRQPPPEEDQEVALDKAKDEAAIADLRTSFKKVHERVDSLEAELARVNAQLRRRLVKAKEPH